MVVGTGVVVVGTGVVVVGTGVVVVGIGSSYRDWETDRKSTRLNSSHRL